MQGRKSSVAIYAETNAIRLKKMFTPVLNYLFAGELTESEGSAGSSGSDDGEDTDGEVKDKKDKSKKGGKKRKHKDRDKDKKRHKQDHHSPDRSRGSSSKR